MQQGFPNVNKEQEIDLKKLAGSLWHKRRLILYCCAIGGMIGLIIAISIPKEYCTHVKLSPENAEKSKSSQWSGLAMMAGIQLGPSSSQGALSVDLYPDIVGSTPFLLELTHVEVESIDKGINTLFYDYIIEYQKEPWWVYLVGAPSKMAAKVAGIFNKDTTQVSQTIDPFFLTPRQNRFIQSVRNRIKVEVDKKTGVITAAIWMQDPLISATMMTSVVKNLQRYITEYRTQKAKQDLAFTQKLYREAKDAYYDAQRNFADCMDENKYTSSANGNVEKSRLEDEMNLAYNVYNQMAQQLEMNKIKVQEQTPAFTVIEPAHVSLRADKPDTLFVLLASVLLAGGGCICMLLIKGVFEAKD